MPAGVSWAQYIGFSVAALVSMGVGAQVVHRFYQPLSDLEDYVQKELTRVRGQELEMPKEALHR